MKIKLLILLIVGIQLTCFASLDYKSVLIDGYEYCVASITDDNKISTREFVKRNLETGELEVLWSDEEKEKFGPAISHISTNSSGTKLCITTYTRNKEINRLVILDVASGVSRTVLTDNMLFTYPAFSPDSTKVAFYFSNPLVEVWQNELEKGHKSCAIMVNDLTTSQTWEVAPPSRMMNAYSYPSWSPDGKNLAFEALYLGEGGLIGTHVFKVDLKGNDPIRLSQKPQSSNRNPMWMSDNRIYFMSSYKDESKKRIYGIFSNVADGSDYKMFKVAKPASRPDFTSSPDKSVIYLRDKDDNRKPFPRFFKLDGTELTDKPLSSIHKGRWKRSMEK